ncbi:protein prenyltransferase alpha subunit repeat-containing protein 1-like [Diadema antillarum]|uniref:protein prenyltransferase alpha subunit repeat-containing protein 1-like n=1 Tax=Diadema antillarum TaxID=105358 RepID=UPI003A84E3FA
MVDDSRQKRILSDLSSALRRDPNIDEFDFIYCPEPVVNKSPVVLENHKLGLATWSIKILFNYVYTNLMKQTGLVKDLKSIHEFSQAALLLNPECYAIWNMRKGLVLKNFIKAENELRYATLIQTKHPKSPETFIQRRWLLQQLFPSVQSSPSLAAQNCPNSSLSRNSNAHNAVQLNGNSSVKAHPTLPMAAKEVELTDRHRQTIQHEMEACRAAADRYPSNYNAWSHRIWVLQRIAGLDVAVLEQELESTKTWVSQHISDHSGFSYRHFLLRALSEGALQQDRVVALVKAELLFTSALIQSFPGHEAIWYHRRSVLNVGRTCLQMKTGNTSFCQDGGHMEVNGCRELNGHGSHQRGVDSEESSVPGEGEWFPLLDYSNLKTAEMEIPNLHDDEMTSNVSLRVLVSSESEVLFMDAVHKKAFDSDRPLLHRCIDHHRRWLQSVKY